MRGEVSKRQCVYSVCLFVCVCLCIYSTFASACKRIFSLFQLVAIQTYFYDFFFFYVCPSVCVGGGLMMMAIRVKSSTNPAGRDLGPQFRREDLEEKHVTYYNRSHITVYNWCGIRDPPSLTSGLNAGLLCKFIQNAKHKIPQGIFLSFH